MVVPNVTQGVQTRAVAAQAAEYDQERQNDKAIREVLAQFGGDDDPLDMLPPESLHTVDSMETCSINLWDSVFRDNTLRTSTPIIKQSGFGATHPGGSVDIARAVGVGIAPDRYHGAYTNWSEMRAGWAVLVPNRFLSESSFHTGDTPTWTQGDIIGERLHRLTGKKMVLCNLGGFDSECHLDEKMCGLPRAQRCVRPGARRDMGMAGGIDNIASVPRLQWFFQTTSKSTRVAPFWSLNYWWPVEVYMVRLQARAPREVGRV